MLEASGFDFRNRHPQSFLLKLAKHYGLNKHSPVVKAAYQITLDLYRTFAPLKQSTATLAFACFELAVRLSSTQRGSNLEQNEINFVREEWREEQSKRWKVERAGVMGMSFQSPNAFLCPPPPRLAEVSSLDSLTFVVEETLLDLLELYTHYQKQTVLGSEFPIDAFLEVRIPLNDELNSLKLPRFTEYMDISRKPNINGVNGTLSALSSGNNPNNIPIGSHRGSGNTSPSSRRNNLTPPTGTGVNTPNSMSARSGPTRENGMLPNMTGSSLDPATGLRQKTGDRGKEGTVRFVLNPDRERLERGVVAEYMGTNLSHRRQKDEEAGRDVQGPGDGRGGRNERDNESGREREAGRDRPPAGPQHNHPHPGGPGHPRRGDFGERGGRGPRGRGRGGGGHFGHGPGRGRP